MSVINLSFFIEELPAIFRPLPQTFLIRSNLQISNLILIIFKQKVIILILFTRKQFKEESIAMIQCKSYNDNLQGILKRCELKSDIDPKQLRDMLHIIVESIMKIKINKSIFPQTNQSKLHLKSKTAETNGIKLMRNEQKVNESINHQELKSEISKFQKKLEFQLKQLREKIDNEGYQVEKRLYSKLKYLLQQMGKQVDLFSPKKQLKLKEEVINKARNKNENFKSLRKMSIYQQQRDQQVSDHKSLQMNDIKSVMSEGDSFLFTNSFCQNRCSIQKQYSIQNVQSNMSKHKTIIKNQSQKPIIKPIQFNIRVEGIRKSCKIKIETTRMWIAIGVIDMNYAQKSIKDIGGRCVYYCNDKQVWDGRKITYNQGIGFVTGDIVQISFDLASKVVEWRVRNKLRHSLIFTSLSFKENWVPFVYFFNKNDCVSVFPNEK